MESLHRQDIAGTICKDCKREKSPAKALIRQRSLIPRCGPGWRGGKVTIEKAESLMI